MTIEDALAKVTLEQLNHEQREIAECIGIENFLKLCDRYGDCKPIELYTLDSIISGTLSEKSFRQSINELETRHNLKRRRRVIF